MEAFSELWGTCPIGAVSTFLSLRGVKHTRSGVNTEVTKILFVTCDETIWHIIAKDGDSPYLEISAFGGPKEKRLHREEYKWIVGEKEIHEYSREDHIKMIFHMLSDIEKLVSGEVSPGITTTRSR
jgi:hypothetical protein